MYNFPIGGKIEIYLIGSYVKKLSKQFSIMNHMK